MVGLTGETDKNWQSQHDLKKGNKSSVVLRKQRRERSVFMLGGENGHREVSLAQPLNWCPFSDSRGCPGGCRRKALQAEGTPHARADVGELRVARDSVQGVRDRKLDSKLYWLRRVTHQGLCSRRWLGSGLKGGGWQWEFICSVLETRLETV